MTRIATAVFLNLMVVGCGSSDDGPGAWGGLGGKGETAGSLILSLPHTFNLTGQAPVGEALIWSQSPVKTPSVKISLASAWLTRAADNWPMGGFMKTGLDFRLHCGGWLHRRRRALRWPRWPARLRQPGRGSVG